MIDRGTDRRASVLAAGAVVLLGLGMLQDDRDGEAGAPWRAPVPAAHASGPPPGHTGGFGEPTCRACHSEYDLNVDGRLTVEGLPDRWEPGRTYTVTLRLESEGMERAGFQGALRWTSGKPSGRPAGAVAVMGDGVVEASGGEYVQHAPGGVWTDGAATWSFDWVAPPEPGGAIAFHAAANSANGDASPFGDIVYTVTDTLAAPSPTPTSAPAP